MKILLRDRNPAMVDAWKQEFKDNPDVEVSLGDIFDVKADAIVSPANSFGWMMGGIDGAYSRRWPDIQKTLRDQLAEHHYGELPVGLATIVPTGDAEIPWLISAPTMRVSSSIRGTVNAYLAFRAALAAVCRHNRTVQDRTEQISSILCPGMGTAVGMMDCHVAARQMHAAYKKVIQREPGPTDPGQMYENHSLLIGEVKLLPAPPKPVEVAQVGESAQAEPPPAFEPAGTAGNITSAPSKPKPPGKKPAKQVGKAKAKVQKAAKVSLTKAGKAAFDTKGKGKKPAPKKTPAKKR